MFAVLCIAFEDAVEIDVANIAQFGDAVAGDKADRAEVQEGLDALSRRLDDVFAEAMEVGLAGGAASTSVVTPRSAPHSDGRMEISVPPCQICT